MAHEEYRYRGSNLMTRGDYGVRIVGGHTSPDWPGMICVFDPDFGDEPLISVDAALQSGEWFAVSN